MEQLQTIPDDAPTVSFDVKFGQDYSRVDFDYDAYRREAMRLGMRAVDSSKLKVMIHSKEGKLLRGYYAPDENEIHTRSLENVNRILSHETCHAADVANGIHKTDVRQVIGKIGTGLFLLSPLTLLGGCTAAVLWERGENISQIATATTWAALVSQWSFYWGYLTHPSEIRARQAGRTSKHQTVTLSSSEPTAD